MRINSRFKDYYDLVMGQGIDTSLIYNRFTKTEPIKCEASWVRWDTLKYNYIYDNTAIWMHKQVIGFCGKLYVTIGALNKIPSGAKDNNAITYCYSEQDFTKFVTEHYDESIIEKYHKRLKHNHSYFSKQYMENAFSVDQVVYRTTSIKELQKHFEVAPIFVIVTEDGWSRPYSIPRSNTFDQVRHIIYNPRLSDFNFAKMMDPYTTYQELNIYLSNIAVPIKPIPHIDDVTMAEIKGFDKTSFRKERTSRKWKPKRV